MMNRVSPMKDDLVGTPGGHTPSGFQEESKKEL
jgi:hypothetical protein